MNFLYCFKAEWIKKKGSLAAWLVIIGGFFTPAINTCAAIYRSEVTRKALVKPDFWSKHWLASWDTIAMFLLPMGVILATSLVTQIEFKNNTWKQLHTTPQSYTHLFFAKLAVILVMLLQFLVIFTIGTYLSGIIPSLVISNASWPTAEIPYGKIFSDSIYFFVDCLPIVAIQFLLSLQFKNFLVSVGAGIALWITAIVSLSWKYSYLVPFSQGALFYLKNSGRITRDLPVHQVAVFYFVVVTIISYILYITKKEKG